MGYSAEKLLQSMATAGFLVLSHTCYQVESVVIPVPPSPIFSSMDFVTQRHHSLLTALCHSSLVPVVRLRCGNRAVTLKGCKRTLLKESIKVIGKLPAYCLVAVEDSKREGLMKDNAVPIAVKYFRDLLLKRVQTVPR